MFRHKNISLHIVTFKASLNMDTYSLAKKVNTVIFSITHLAYNLFLSFMYSPTVRA